MDQLNYTICLKVYLTLFEYKSILNSSAYTYTLVHPSPSAEADSRGKITT